MTEEQRKAQSEKMKAFWAAKRAEAEKQKAAEASTQTNTNSSTQTFSTSTTGGTTAGYTAVPEPLVTVPIAQAVPSIAEENVSDLLRRIQELEQRLSVGIPMLPPQQPVAQSPHLFGGRLVGVVDKYVVDPEHYPDPRARLFKEPRLQRFAFDQNYELSWDVSTTRYETKEGLNVQEPKFTIGLIRVMFDDITGEPTNGRYMICNAIFHEDPQSAIVIAREKGLPVEDNNEKEFLDEMRYLRMRDWLFEAFYPPITAQAKKNKKEMVIGNKLVDYWEVNSEDAEVMPFNQLNSKL